MIFNIFLSIIIVLLAIIAIWFLWTRDIDFKEWISSKIPKIPLKKEAPKIEYGISTLESNYGIDQLVDGITWRSNYSRHLLTIVNTSNDNCYNFIVSINFPGAIVKNKIESNVNVFDINFSSFNQPIEIKNSENRVIILDNVISNTTDISIASMNKHSTLTISFILDYRNKPQGFWRFDISYEYEASENKKMRNRIINPINIILESPLTLQINRTVDFVGQDSVQATQDKYPFNPTISKADGRFIPLEDFKGDIENIKTENGDGIIFSTGFDYFINTDKEYK